MARAIEFELEGVTWSTVVNARRREESVTAGKSTPHVPTASSIVLQRGIQDRNEPAAYLNNLNYFMLIGTEGLSNMKNGLTVEFPIPKSWTAEVIDLIEKQDM